MSTNVVISTTSVEMREQFANRTPPPALIDLLELIMTGE
jgi:hypothetical protein